MQLPQPSGAINSCRFDVQSAVIKNMHSLTHDTYEIVVERERFDEPFFGQAGQFATLKFPGIDRPRPYSFARAPENEKPGEHTFFIRRVLNGEVSQWLAAGDRTGESVEIGGPMGKFGLDSSLDPMVCIAGGSGMSAIKAILEYACNRQVARDCFFYYGARSQRDLYAVEQFEHIKQRWSPNHKFEFIQILSEEPDSSGWYGPRGLVTDYVETTLVDSVEMDMTHCKVFFCGPPPMIAKGVDLFRNAGVRDDAMFCDVFEDASSPAPTIDNIKCVLCDECLLVKPVENCIVEASDIRNVGQGQPSKISVVDPGSTSGLYYNSLVIDETECIRCYGCVDACPHDAISAGNPPNLTSLRQRT